MAATAEKEVEQPVGPARAAISAAAVVAAKAAPAEHKVMAVKVASPDLAPAITMAAAALMAS
jgi:hypothetical protein